MRRALVLLSVAACATPPPPAHPSCVVTVREPRHVIGNGVIKYGDCGPDEAGPELNCRNFFAERTYERDGRCSDGEVGGVVRVSCVDKAPATSASTSSNGVGRNLLGALAILPLLLVYCVVTQGNHT